MSIIKDFKELHIGLKTSILTILCQMPFFFIAIFLFKYNLIVNISEYPLIDMDFWFLISLCFCFSLTWFFMNVALTFILIPIIDKISGSKPTELNNIYVGSMIISIFFLSISIIISYKFNLSFNCFLSISYLYIIFRIIESSITSFFV